LGKGFAKVINIVYTYNNPALSIYDYYMK